MKKTIWVGLMLATACFIFINSAKTAEISKGVSGGVIAWLNDTLGISLSQFAVRKLAHFGEFTFLGGLIYASASSFLRSEKTIVLVSLALGGIYAATDEFHQLFVAGRSCEFRDWCIDFSGVLLGVIVAGVIKRIFF